MIFPRIVPSLPSIAAMCAAMLAAASLTAGAARGEIVLENPGFENGAMGWKIPEVLWRICDGAGREGSAALVYENQDPAAYAFPRCPIDVRPGEIYRYGAWAKAEALEKGGRAIAPKVSIDYADANGEWIGAEYASAVSGPDADGWVFYEGITAPVPAAAASANLFGFVPKGGTGRACFDDFAIAKAGERIIDAFATSAYRDEAYGGEVKFVATLFPNSTPPEALAPVFAFKASNGTMAEVAPDEFDASHAAATIDVARLAQGTHPVAFILRTRDGRELARASLGFTRGGGPRRVTFDRFGRTLVEGRPFFPLGMYARDVTPGTLALYMDDAPWNCVMPYHAPSREMLDLCDQSGLKVVYCVKDIVFGAQFAKPPFDTSREASLDRIATLADEVGNHPAILAYYTNDEAPPRQAGILREVRSLLHGIDPDHPVWHVIDKAYKVRPMLGAFDVLGTDPYPVGLEERLPRQSDLGEVTRSIRAAQAEMFGATPMWQVVQAFDWTWDGRWKHPSQRFPSREEISCMTWQAIANGANGIIYYAFHRICMGAKPTEKRDDYLRRVVLAAAEVREMMPVLLSEPGPNVISAPNGAVCRAWRTNPGEVTILAANATRSEVAGEITLSGGIPPLSVAIPPMGHVFVTVNSNH